MKPRSDPNIEFWCFYARGVLQKMNRRVGVISSLRYLRLTNHPEFGEPDDTYLPFIRNPEYKGVLSPYQVNVSRWYEVEVMLEKVRKADFVEFPSRLSVIYLFDDLTDVEKARQRYPNQFCDRDLVKLKPIYCEKLCQFSRHDMGWIDFLRDYPIGRRQIESAMHSYWRGEPCEGIQYQGQYIHTEPIWEVLYDGALTFVED